MFEFPVRKPADHASLEERTRRWAREEFERRLNDDEDEDEGEEAVLDVAAVVRERDDSAVGGG